jgi:hypothetical protein
MKNPKWLTVIRALRQDYQDWYEERSWNKDGFVKTMARIDVPADGAILEPGTQRLAGIAYAGDRGIQQVEFSLDNAVSWRPAAVLEPPPGHDVMIRWESTFTMPPGSSLTITVRATDATGEVQTAQFNLPQPDGATGQHAITVSTA